MNSDSAAMAEVRQIPPMVVDDSAAHRAMTIDRPGGCIADRQPQSRVASDTAAEAAGHTVEGPV